MENVDACLLWYGTDGNISPCFNKLSKILNFNFLPNLLLWYVFLNFLPDFLLWFVTN